MQNKQPFALEDLARFSNLIKIDLKSEDDPIHQISSQIMKNRMEIIDLFCSAFLCVQEDLSIESLKILFGMVELECNIDGLKETYRIKLKD